MTHKSADGQALCTVAAQVADITLHDTPACPAGQSTTAVPAEVSCPRCIALNKALRHAPTTVENTTAFMKRHMPKQDIAAILINPANGLDCEICGTQMQDRSCKITCPNCGFTRDCSDP